MLKSELDEIDLKILAELQANARLRNVELAEKVGLSASPCLRRVRRLEPARSRPEGAGLPPTVAIQPKPQPAHADPDLLDPRDIECRVDDERAGE